MSESPAGKDDKNRLRGDSLKKYDQSKLWVNLKKKKQYGEPVNHKIDWDSVIKSLPEAFKDNYEDGE